MTVKELKEMLDDALRDKTLNDNSDVMMWDPENLVITSARRATIEKTPRGPYLFIDVE